MLILKERNPRVNMLLHAPEILQLCGFDVEEEREHPLNYSNHKYLISFSKRTLLFVEREIVEIKFHLIDLSAILAKCFNNRFSPNRYSIT